MPAPKEILTATEAAKLIRMRLETFKELAESGQIPGRRINTRGDWRFNRVDIQNWIRSGNVNSQISQSEAS